MRFFGLFVLHIHRTFLSNVSTPKKKKKISAPWTTTPANYFRSQQSESFKLDNNVNKFQQPKVERVQNSQHNRENQHDNIKQHAHNVLRNKLDHARSELKPNSKSIDNNSIINNAESIAQSVKLAKRKDRSKQIGLKTNEDFSNHELYGNEKTVTKSEVIDLILKQMQVITYYVVLYTKSWVLLVHNTKLYSVILLCSIDL